MDERFGKGKKNKKKTQHLRKHKKCSREVKVMAESQPCLHDFNTERRRISLHQFGAEQRFQENQKENNRKHTAAAGDSVSNIRTIKFRIFESKTLFKMKTSAVQHSVQAYIRQNPLGGAKDLQIVQIEGLIA